MVITASIEENFNFPKGKIRYYFDREVLDSFNLDIFRGGDTILVPHYLEADINNVKVVEKFLQESMKKQIKPLR